MKIKQLIARQFALTLALMERIPWWMTVCFVLSVVSMNLLASKCIVSMKYLALDAGLLVSWGAFLGMDLVVKLYGARAANRLAIVAVVCNVVVTCFFCLAAAVPGTWSEAYAPQHVDAINEALNATFSGSWYVLVGSMASFLASSFVNNILNSFIGRRLKHDDFRAFAYRAYLSTTVAQMVDNLLFALLISKGFFGWTLVQCLMCALSGVALELAAEVVTSPLGYFLCKKIQNGQLRK